MAINEKNKFKSFINQKIIEQDTIKLSQISSLENVNSEIRDALTSFYDHSDMNIQKMGTIFNAIYTQKTHIFLLSFRIFNNLLKNDPNIKCSSCHIKNYKYIIYKLISINVLKILRNHQFKKAALYELVEDLYLDVLKQFVDKQSLDEKKQICLEWYDSINKSNNLDDNICQEYLKTLGEIRERKRKRKINDQ